MPHAEFKLVNGRFTFHPGLRKVDATNDALARIAQHYPEWATKQEAFFDALLAYAAMLDAGVSVADLDALKKASHAKLDAIAASKQED